MIRMPRQDGRSCRVIASILNADGYRARQGGYWHASQVKRVLDPASLSKPRQLHLSRDRNGFTTER